MRRNHTALAAALTTNLTERGRHRVGAAKYAYGLPDTNASSVVRCITIAFLLLSIVAGLTRPASGATLNISSTDLWDVSQGTTVIADSGALDYGGLPYISDTRNMFGASLPAGTLEPYNTLFKDNQPAGTVHFVEWQTLSQVTLRSFALFGAHDGAGRTADDRGISSFELFAWNASTSQYDSIFTYTPGYPYYSSSVAPANGFLADNCTANNVLCLGVNLLPTTTNKFRAEFVQTGVGDNSSGPRIWELDGFNTFLQGASVPATPLPATLPLFVSSLGVMGLLVWRRKRKVGATAS